MRDFRILLFIFASSKLKTLMHSLFKVILAFCLTFFAGNRMIAARRIIMTDLSSLDSCIKVKPGIDARYEAHLSAMKNKLRFAGVTSKQRLHLLGDLVKAYSSYQFDSAFIYTKRYRSEALRLHDQHAVIHANLAMGLLLSYAGFYNNAETIIAETDYKSLPQNLRFTYAIAGYWTYVYWSAFTMDAEFSSRMDHLRMHYLTLALDNTTKRSAMWYYLMGERSYFLRQNPLKAIAYYKSSLRLNNHYGRLYSQTAFAIARGYQLMGNSDAYGKYLVLSAKSDILASVKENAALQDLAMYIFKEDASNATLAHHYLLVAMDDATFFNNKLRKLEISNRLPPIATAYQQQLKRQSRILWGIVFLAIVLALGASALYFLSRRRNAQLHLSQRLLEHKNSQLNDVNQQMQETNDELSHLNNLLREANRKREEYLRLFVDICASTMDRITSYRTLVQMKIKANQTKDLLRVVSSDRIANHDMARFYLQFDKAFLGLYPDFVSEFSRLLKPGNEVSLNTDGSMTTELRIFAFIRLGVTESSEIATLLSYSPHTIYNYRSAMKAKAVDKEHFEENVRNLCHPS